MSLPPLINILDPNPNTDNPNVHVLEDPPLTVLNLPFVTVPVAHAEHPSLQSLVRVLVPSPSIVPNQTVLATAFSFRARSYTSFFHLLVNIRRSTSNF
jgi:hypothetical protein